MASEKKTFPPAERRKFIRIPSKDIITCKKYGVVSGHDAQEVMLRNISAEGILFQSKEQYALGDVVKIEIYLPGWEKFNQEFYKDDALSYQRPLVALGTVSRIELISSGTYDVGVYLSGVDEGHRWALGEYIKSKATKE